MKKRLASGWISSHMHRKIITILVSSFALVLILFCLAPLEKQTPIKNYHTREHIYPHQPNRDFLFYPANDELNDLQGRRFLNLNNLRIPKEDECQADPDGREKHKLLPNVIGLGAKKCGTTALHYYMTAHPKVKVSQDHEELAFFDKKWENGIDWYLDKLPEVAEDEIVFEKTPKYFVFPPALDRIAETVPNAKFILVICDPVERAFSDYNHKVRKSSGFRRFLLENKIENFDDFVMRHSPRLRILKEKKMSSLLENDLYNNTWHNGHLSILTVGFYSYYLRKFIDKFSRQQFLILTGEEIRHSPTQVMDKVQGFMDLPRCVTGDNFVFNSTKGFYCVINFKGDEVCLDSNKGTSRKGDERKYLIETGEELANLYGPYSRELSKLGINVSWPFPTGST